MWSTRDTPTDRMDYKIQRMLEGSLLYPKWLFLKDLPIYIWQNLVDDDGNIRNAKKAGYRPPMWDAKDYFEPGSKSQVGRSRKVSLKSKVQRWSDKWSEQFDFLKFRFP